MTKTTQGDRHKSCDTCANRGPYRDDLLRGRTYKVADCNASIVSAFWKMRGEKPQVFAGCGSDCDQFEPIQEGDR